MHEYVYKHAYMHKYTPRRKHANHGSSVLFTFIAFTPESSDLREANKTTLPRADR